MSPIDGQLLEDFMDSLYGFDSAAKKRIADAIRRDPDFSSLPNPHNLSKKDRFCVLFRCQHFFWMAYTKHAVFFRYLLAGHKLKLYYEKLRSGEAAAAPYLIKTELEKRLFYFLVLGPDGSSTGITHLMFEPTIAKQASDEQRAAWLPAAQRMVCI